MNVISVTGTHGSGKTTFVSKLEKDRLESGERVYVVREVARSCPYQLGTISSQEWIWNEQIKQEKYAIRQDVDTILLDRMTLDNLIYYWAVIEDLTAPHDQEAYFARWQKLYKEAKEWMQTYSQVIRLPLNIEWLQVDDPIRPKDVDYARRIDKLFDRFVDPFVTQHGASND